MPNTIEQPIKLSFDKIDLAILDVLQQNANCSIAEISAQVGLSHTPCWKWVKRLQKDGFIRAQVSLLEQHKIGMAVTAFAQVTVNLAEQDGLGGFEEAVADIPEVLEYYLTSGDRNYLMRIVSASIDSYQILLKKRLIHLPGVSAIDSIMVLSTIKHSTRLPISDLYEGVKVTG